MRPSEALRIGAKLAPQSFRGYARLGDDGVLCTCALGAMYHAIVGHPPRPLVNAWEITRLLPELEGDAPHDLVTLASASCRRQESRPRVFDAVMCLNDCARVSREEIADILEGFGL